MSLLKVKKVDIGCAVAVSSLLHQRYKHFTEEFKTALLAALSDPSDQDKEVEPEDQPP